jgi:hypothetical protein
MQHSNFNKSKQGKPKEVIVINVKCEDKQMINKNRWVVDNDYTSDSKFPCWQGKILRSKNKEELEKNTRRIYALAYDEELYRVIKKGKQCDNPEILFGVTNFDFHPVKRKDGSTDFLNKDGLDWHDDCEQQCKISYYDLDGQVVTEWVGNFYNFHANLRPEKYLELDRNDRNFYASPIPIYIEEGYDSGYEIYKIILCSDIWFPRVVGWLDSEEQFYDNSELAALNTPRLNRFLKRTKELILSLGGEWELVGGKPVAVDKYDVETSYYHFDPIDTRIVDSQIVCVDGVQKEVYPPLSNYTGVENIPPECQLSENGISLEIDIKPRNLWCILTHEKSEEDLPRWEAEFPAKKFATHQDFWPFLKTILEVGQQEEIFQIFAEEAEFHQFIHDVDSGILPMPYLEILHSGIADTRLEEELVTDNLPEYIRNIQGVTKVSYYEKNGQITDKYVGEHDLGKILYNYHLGSLGNYQSNYHYGKTYLHPYYGCLTFYEYLIPECAMGECSVTIMLTSDIWFPIVKGSLEKKVGIWHTFGADEAGYCEGGFDNRELANRHTPRLNRFLSAIAAKVIEMGGEWSIGEYIDPKYKEQMTLTGIKLDI